MASRSSWFYFAIAVAALTTFTYNPIVDSYFLSDDFNHLFALSDLDGSPRWWLAIEHWWSPQHFFTFRPLVTLHELIIFSMFGADPAAFHSANIILHLCNCLLLAILIERIAATAGVENSRMVAMAAGFLFAIHPLHSEAVTWIASVPVLQCMFFYLLSLVAAFNWMEQRARAWLLAALVAFVLALASKEEAVSLPGMVALLSLFLRLRRDGWKDPIAGAIEIARRTLPFAIVLALYFLYRIQIFGNAVSIVSFDGPRQVLLYLKATLNSAARFLEPVNFVHAGEFGPELASAYGIILLLALAIGSWVLLRAGRIRLWAGYVVFGSVAFAILIVPGHSVLLNGPEAGLDLSRFLYMPSAAAVLIIAGLLFSQSGHPAAVRWVIFGALVAAGVVTLRVNNDAWSVAGETMRRMQAEAAIATGRDPRAEVVNMPDKVAGVYFDRGGWRFAQLAPFGAGGKSGLAWRRLEMVNDLPSEAAIATRGAGEDFGPVSPLPPTISSGERIVVDWRFDPSEAKIYQAGLVAVDLCGRAGDTSLVALSGVGKDLPLGGSGLLAFIADTRASGAVTEIDIRVVTPGGGPVVADIRIELTPGGPFEMIEPVPAFDMPPREEKTVTIRIRKRPGGAAWPTQPVEVYAANAGAAPLVLQTPQLLIPNPGGSADSIGIPERSRKGDAPVEPLLLSDYCEDTGRTPQERDFGYLSVEPHLPTVGDPVTVFPATPPMRLFWNDQRKRLVPFERAAGAPVILEHGPRELLEWTTPEATVKHLAGTGGLATFTPQSQLSLTSPVLPEIDPSSVSYAIIEMRLSQAPGSFAFLDWSGEVESFASRGWALLVVVPDGRWRTYAIPLHSDPRWAGGPIRQLRLSPASYGGYVEMRSFRLIGPIP